jgi:hypothetical protein
MLTNRASEVTDQFSEIMDMNLRPQIRTSQLSDDHLDERDVDADLKELLDELEEKKRSNRIDISQGAFIDTLSMYNKT